MTDDDPRAALRAAAAGPDDAATALLALRHALAWAARALATDRPHAATDPAAVELVIAVDDALTEVDELVRQVPDVAEAGVAGTPVTEYLNQQAEALAELADRVAVTRREHEALFAVEAELRACGAEHDEIQRHVAELHRLERLARDLPAIRDQRDSLARRLATMRSPVAEAEDALAATAHEVLVLREELLANLDTRTQELLRQVRDVEARWADQRRRLAEDESRLRDKVAEYEKLRTERDGLLRAAAAHAEIDRDLVDRLAAVREGGPLDKVRAMLSDVRTTLDTVDSALADALARHDRFAEEHRRVLPWRDESTVD
ncbi:coiled-coil domain-containing protein [Goodfellowiella coeruleoviolacea]|uniref:Uncharacterized protein n=1 Tax=Goodfellowiella coeruleoviolacea TaxID=334858 RepID=A0AAE3GH65_9PSEU|nr:hypothetical protein [Goodfellowiella coeruleoviolacea]MCP2167289.1 hypothetical protein [Goodfellowiella coeruleoviolacea]